MLSILATVFTSATIIASIPFATEYTTMIIESYSNSTIIYLRDASSDASFLFLGFLWIYGIGLLILQSESRYSDGSF